MTGWLLDTNVLSAFAPGKPAIGPTIAEWFNERSDELFLSAVTAAEIEAGISKLRRTGSERRAGELRAWFERILSFYADREFHLISPRPGSPVCSATRHWLTGAIPASPMSPSRRSPSHASS